MSEKTMKYEDAMRELEAIVDRLEREELDIDTLGSQLQRAQRLIKMCKDKLAKTDAEVRKLLKSDK
ncbi:MAG: exodeoxyribonuclease VII small subunit [Bacteroidales bacterium]|nr:exodeoxyribonuclease VII small subunit [Prevotella sp.]MBR3466997.1 exodeoxyribonuclease VII small subunit [Bacteroidales bacterium]MBR6903845.1 exodeoxyribonuclease VII small subunit [Bacteroidales bacterium]